jgi:hypothetical protein
VKRRRIALGFLVAAVALGAWLIFSAKPAGRVSVHFLGFETNAANERSAVLWITNGHDFPVLCWFPKATNHARIAGNGEARVGIDAHSALSRRCFAEQLAQISASTRQLEIDVLWVRKFTRMERLRIDLGEWLYYRRWRSLSRFVEPVNKETVLSEPIVFPPEIKRE